MVKEIAADGTRFTYPLQHSPTRVLSCVVNGRDVPFCYDDKEVSQLKEDGPLASFHRGSYPHVQFLMCYQHSTQVTIECVW